MRILKKPIRRIDIACAKKANCIFLESYDFLIGVTFKNKDDKNPRVCITDTSAPKSRKFFIVKMDKQDIHDISSIIKKIIGNSTHKESFINEWNWQLVKYSCYESSEPDFFNKLVSVKGQGIFYDSVSVLLYIVDTNSKINTKDCSDDDSDSFSAVIPLVMCSAKRLWQIERTEYVVLDNAKLINPNTKFGKIKKSQGYINKFSTKYFDGEIDFLKRFVPEKNADSFKLREMLDN
jgi:hypothetical protein